MSCRTSDADSPFLPLSKQRLPFQNWIFFSIPCCLVHKKNFLKLCTFLRHGHLWLSCLLLLPPQRNKYMPCGVPRKLSNSLRICYDTMSWCHMPSPSDPLTGGASNHGYPLSHFLIYLWPWVKSSGQGSHDLQWAMQCGKAFGIWPLSSEQWTGEGVQTTTRYCYGTQNVLTLLNAAKLPPGIARCVKLSSL